MPLDSPSFSVENAWLLGARHQPSPNFDERPPNTQVDLLVIHNISLPPNKFVGEYIEDFFLNRLDCSLHPYFEQLKTLRVSSHLLIRRDGEVVQFVPFDKRAWHAGASSFQGRSRCNDFSIGIELEGADDIPYEAEQYLQLVKITQALMNAYPGIVSRHIVGHSEIAPGRKTDPGNAFDWRHFFNVLAKAKGSAE